MNKHSRPKVKRLQKVKVAKPSKIPNIPKTFERKSKLSQSASRAKLCISEFIKLMAFGSFLFCSGSGGARIDRDLPLMQVVPGEEPSSTIMQNRGQREQQCE